MNVLIVDDKIDLLQTLRRGLRARGYGVLTALSADEALAEIFRPGAAIDVVLSDYQMPGKNGADLFRELRARRNDVPFVFITAYADSIPGGRSIWEAGDGVIEKPCTMEKIIVCLEAAVERRSAKEAMKNQLTEDYDK